MSNSAKDNYWDDDPEWPSSDWRFDVSEENTRLGYWDWVAQMREAVRENIND